MTKQDQMTALSMEIDSMLRHNDSDKMERAIDKAAEFLAIQRLKIAEKQMQVHHPDNKKSLQCSDDIVGTLIDVLELIHDRLEEPNND